MKPLAEDLRYACRVLRRSPGFTVVATLTLALAIGATGTIFSAVNAVLLRGLPYPDPNRLVLIWGEERQRGIERGQVSYPDVADWLQQNQVFEDVAAYTGAWTPALSGPSGVEQLAGVRVSDRFFRVMEAQALLGRTFLPGEQFENGGNIAVLSYGLWERGFGKDPSIVGRKIVLDGKPYSVVGVLPQSFRSLPVRLIDQAAEIYRPLSRDFSDEIRDGRHLRSIARLKPGVTLEQAQQEMQVIARRLELAYPDENLGHGVRLVGMREDLVENIRPSLLILQVSVLMTVLIACANVANLLLVQSAARRKEVAIRQAMGANRGRLIRQKLTESLLLGAAGGAAGLLVAFWCVPVIQSLGAKAIPELAQVNIDWRVVSFCAALSLVTGVLFGLAPAFETYGGNPAAILNERGRGSGAAAAGRRRRNLLVVLETAVAVTLLICAGLLVNSFVRLRHVNPGFDPRNTLAVDLPLPAARYPDGPTRAALVEDLLEQVQRLPGVASASIVSVLPESSNFNRMFMEIEGRAYERASKPAPDQYEVTPEYFRTLSIPLVRGRLFTAEDDANHAQVALLNQTAARRLWPGEDPIGRKVRTGGSSGAWRTVVGIVGDVYQYGLDSQKTMQIYVPYLQNRVSSVTLLVRGVQEARPLVPGIRAAVASIDRELPLAGVSTMDEVLSDSVSGRRFSMVLLAALGACAMMLATIGIYGVTAYSVAQRLTEFGIRMALGAQAGSVILLVMRQNLALIGIGTALGLGEAATLTRFLSSLLFGVSPYDPATFAAASATLAFVALAASYVPARRATEVDPMAALRRA
ncbi:MAG: ABC transporter permease [Acidobacteriia bacterium]|nr:ABC transporter permease [Terriglobia bacterium]